MIKLNIPYTNKIIAQELFGVKTNTFSRNKKKYLDYLKKFFVFDVIDNKIVLRKEIKPFQTKREVRKRIKQVQKEIYRELTHKIIAYKPLNSGSNIAREIYSNPLKPIQKHQQGTIENYVRPILREDFIVKGKKWCKINYAENVYQPLREQEVEYLYGLFESRNVSKEIMGITAEYKAGNISRKDFVSKVSQVSEFSYDKVIDQFKKKYGFRPLKASEWEEQIAVKEAED